MPTMTTIPIGFNINDSLASIRALVGALEPLFECDDRNRSWNVDLRECKYLGPDSAATLLAFVLDARAYGLTVNVMLPDKPPPLLGFCAFSGLKHLFERVPLPDLNDPENETIPLRQFTKANFRDADPIINLIQRHTEISQDSEDYLRICVNEITQNVEDHSRSRVGGVCCARYMAGTNEVRVAIVDCGAGIAETLREKHPDIQTGSVALGRVTVGNTTAQSKPNNRGLGISQLWNIVGTLGGSVFILSGDGFAEHRGGRGATIGSLNPPFPGTGVYFSLPMS